jgi:hypothetical protein
MKYNRKKIEGLLKTAVEYNDRIKKEYDCSQTKYLMMQVEYLQFIKPGNKNIFEYITMWITSFNLFRKKR